MFIHDADTYPASLSLPLSLNNHEGLGINVTSDRNNCCHDFTRHNFYIQIHTLSQWLSGTRQLTYLNQAVSLLHQQGINQPPFSKIGSTKFSPQQVQIVQICSKKGTSSMYRGINKYIAMVVMRSNLTHCNMRFTSWLRNVF
ncbi:hypothetical protein VNO77_22901 [Canavalia gladiata]|uniref:Uncharacterized protein n=1 Tax=Canavalia gladiata TaxID=3824 RepID=A0AAN9L3G6_CANGL